MQALDKALKFMEGGVPAAQNHPFRRPSKTFNAVGDLLSTQELRVPPNLTRIDGVHRVAPRATKIATTKSNEVTGKSSFGAFSLDGRAEDLDDWEELELLGLFSEFLQLPGQSVA